MKLFTQLMLCHLRSFVRDRAAFFWSFAFPAFFIVIFGLIFGGDEYHSRFAVGVAVKDNSPAARLVVDSFKKVPVFDIKHDSPDALLRQLRDGKLRAVIVVPAGIETKINDRETVTFTVHYDPSHQTSQVVLSIVRQVISAANQMMTQTPPLLRADERPLQMSLNRQRHSRYIFFLLPGIVAMSIMQLGLFSAVPMVIFREQGILKRLGATPLPRSKFAVTQMIFRVALGFLQTTWLLALGALLFGFRVEGSLLLLLAFVVLGVFTFTIIGALLGSLAKTQETAMPMVQLVNFPFMFFSGIFFPIEMVPHFMQPLVKAIPTTYLAKALRDISWGVCEWSSLGWDALVLALWALACLLLTFKLFRWE